MSRSFWAIGGVGLWPAMSPFVATFFGYWYQLLEECRHEWRHGRPEAHSTIAIPKLSDIGLKPGPQMILSLCCPARRGSTPRYDLAVVVVGEHGEDFFADEEGRLAVREPLRVLGMAAQIRRKRPKCSSAMRSIS